MRVDRAEATATQEIEAGIVYRAPAEESFLCPSKKDTGLVCLRNFPVDLPDRSPRHRGHRMDRYEVYKAQEHRRSTLDAPTTRPRTLSGHPLSRPVNGERNR